MISRCFGVTSIGYPCRRYAGVRVTPFRISAPLFFKYKGSIYV
jgi:hypothetical protein